MKLKLKDLVLLRQELNGLSDRTTGQVFYKGLLVQDIHFKAKYHLSKLSKEIEKEIEQLTESEKELFKKHFGETEPEQTKEFFESDAFMNYNADRSEFFEEEIEFKDFSFSVDDFDFKSSESYSTFIELFLK
jgi:5'-deoxynucleotidase YfbR-like HD superfamily hydrolase